MIAKTTEDFIVNEVLPELEYLEQHEFDRSVRLLKAGELGLLGADVPEEYGGIGLDKVSSALIAEKFSRWWLCNYSRCSRRYRIFTNRVIR